MPGPTRFGRTFQFSSWNSRMQNTPATRRDVARRLSKILMEKGFTPAELARRAEFPRDRAAKYLSGAQMPSVEYTLAMADALGVEGADIVPGCPTRAEFENSVPPRISEEWGAKGSTPTARAGAHFTPLSDGRVGYGLLTFREEVPFKVAAAIMEIIQQHQSEVAEARQGEAPESRN